MSKGKIISQIAHALTKIGKVNENDIFIYEGTSDDIKHMCSVLHNKGIKYRKVCCCCWACWV